MRHLPIPPVPVARLTLDLETASVDQLGRGGPRFIRLAALSADDGPVQTTVDIDAVTQILQGAGQVVGHNLFGFDLLALALYHGLDIHALVRRGAVVDTLLLAFLDDPPPARISSGQAAKYYSLNSIGTRKFGEGKLGNLTVLAKKHGGYNQIPLDDPEYVACIKRDVDLTRRLAGILPITDYARREHRVAAIAAQITLNGFRVDVPLLNERLAAGREHRAGLLNQLQDTYGVPTTRKDGKPSKAPQNTQEGREAIQAAFAQLGVSLPVTETGAPATGKAAMESLLETHAGDESVCSLARIVKELNGVRTVYSTISDHLVDGRVHPDVNMRQASGRWSIINPGLTVMGKRDGRYAERDVFLPEPGHVIVSADLAQIDARAIAALAQDPGYLALFAPGRDVHAEVATQIWGDPGRREDAKVVSHGWNYGQGIGGIVRQTGVDCDVAEQFDTGMRERFPKLVEWRDGIREQAASGDLLDNGFGRLMRPDVERAWTQGPALMGQGCARDLLMEGLFRLPPEVLPMVRAVVHDEVVLSVPAADADAIEKKVLEALSFSWAPLGAPLSVEVVAGVGKRGASWGDCYRGGSK